MSIVIEELHFSYGDRKILEDIHLDLDDRCMVSILGPNGVGKTTLLKCVCRMHEPECGNVRINNKNVFDFRPRELSKLVSYVPQRSRPSNMTVFDAVMIGRKPHIDWSISEYDIDVVWKILNLLKMEHLSLKYLDNISGGELQKIQIARAIAQNTDIMILDEPTNNLDISNQQEILHLIGQLVEKRGMCAVMTMHDINLALAYSDKYVFVKEGRVIGYGGDEIVTEEIIRETYNVNTNILEHEGRKIVVPEAIQPSFYDISADGLDLFKNDIPSKSKTGDSIKGKMIESV